MVTRATSPARKVAAPVSYVALLRGVNVGGKGRVPMQELRELFESFGFENVRTHIQSGNVIFRSSAMPSTSVLESALFDRFHIASPVVVRTSSELSKVIRNDPFGDVDRSYLHVGFMAQAITDAEVASLELDRFAPERIAAAGTEVYFCLPGGMGNSKLAGYLNRKIGGSMTVRNWNTVTTLAELAAS
jgi:uncharacterized protein (DUF1697 family)